MSLALAGWQGGRVSGQRDVQPQPASRASPDTKYKRAPKVGHQPLAALPPSDENLMSRHLFHQEFGS